MNFKPGNLVRIRRALPFVRCVNLNTADWYEFKADEIALYLSWGGSKHGGAYQVAHILIGEVKCAADEADLELVPVEE